VLAPADESELAHALHTALAMDCPVALRYPRGAGTGIGLPAEATSWEPGRSELRRTGDDVALLAVGRMVTVAEGAAELLAEDGVSARVVNMRWVKPVDAEAIACAARECRLIVSIEESTSVGGFGSAVAETLSDLSLEPPLLRLAVPDCFVTHGAMTQLLSDIGLTADSVRRSVLERLGGDEPIGAQGSEQA
jgi:1-deoxy-D-xylulose-5-phosphate synthase